MILRYTVEDKIICPSSKNVIYFQILSKCNLTDIQYLGIIFLFQPSNMTQFQISEYEGICGIIVQIPKSAMDKIVSPLKNLYCNKKKTDKKRIYVQ